MISIKESHANYTFILLFLALAILGYLVLRPFLIVILMSLVFVYVFHPLYRKFLNWTKRETLSSAITSFIIILVLIIPFVFMINVLYAESLTVYDYVKQNAGFFSSLNESCAATQDGICKLYNHFNQEMRSSPFIQAAYKGLSAVSSYMLQKLSSFIISIPQIILKLFVMFFLIFFLFIDGQRLLDEIKSTIPLRVKHQELIFKRLDEVLSATLYGYVILAFIQGLVALVGYLIFGVSSPFVWGLVTIIAAMLPFIGTALVWIPISFSMIVSGYFSDAGLMWRGIGLAIYAGVLVSSIDNVLRPKIVGKKSGVHPVLILLGALGGIQVFGVAGIILGPVLLAILQTFFEIYKSEEFI